MRTYTTVLGDTFDKIALKELGGEYFVPLLLKKNPKHRTTLVFSAGVILNIPDMEEVMNYENLPEWFEENERTAELLEEFEAQHGVDA